MSMHSSIIRDAVQIRLHTKDNKHIRILEGKCGSHELREDIQTCIRMPVPVLNDHTDPNSKRFLRLVHEIGNRDELVISPNDFEI